MKKSALWEKYVWYVYLTKDLGPQNIKNSYNSERRQKTQFEKLANHWAGIL